MATQVENPFDTQQPSPTNQNIQGGTQPMTTGAPGATPYQQFNPTPNVAAQTYTPQTSQVNAPTETMQGQVSSILSQDNPLMQRARSLATQQMNQRGLVNSSMAQGAGVAAMVDRALPIAQQDAQTYNQRALINQDAINQGNQFNVGQTNQMFQFGQDVASRYGLQTEAQRFQGTQAELDRAQQTQLQSNQFGFQGSQADLDRSLQQALQSNQISAQDAQQFRDIASREGLAAADRALQQALQSNQFGFQGTQADLDRSLQQALQSNQISAQEAQQFRDIASREGLAAADRFLQQALQANQFGFQGGQAALDRSQQMNVLNIQQNFQERMTALEQSGMDFRQAREIASREMLTRLEQAGVDNRFDQELALKSEMFNVEELNKDRRQIADNDAQLERLGLQIKAQNQNIPTNFAASISNTTMMGVNAIMADKDTSPAAKEKAINNLINYANAQISWAEKFYKVAIPALSSPITKDT